MSGLNIGYARVSSVTQNLDRQLEQLKKSGVQKIFKDHASGKDTGRPEFQRMMDFAREGDHIFVSSMDRLSRNLSDLLSVVKGLEERRITVTFIKEQITISGSADKSPMNKMLLSVMGAIAEFERAIILERQQEGIALARARGVYKGRKPLSKEIVAKVHQRRNEGVPVTRIAKDLGVGRSTIYRYLGDKLG